MVKYPSEHVLETSKGGVVDEIGEAGELFNDILILKPKNRFLYHRALIITVSTFLLFYLSNTD